jgi:hypothetical protein
MRFGGVPTGVAMPKFEPHAIDRNRASAYLGYFLNSSASASPEAIDRNSMVVTTCDIIELMMATPHPMSSNSRQGLAATRGDATIL